VILVILVILASPGDTSIGGPILVSAADTGKWQSV
jgi:hypothetical protein